jgi:hypothetical protein
MQAILLLRLPSIVCTSVAELILYPSPATLTLV